MSETLLQIDDGPMLPPDRRGKSLKVLLLTLPADGEVRDRVTYKFFRNPVVKYMPLGVLSLAASLQQKHEVHVLDASSHPLSLDETIEKIESLSPDILGISAVTYRAWAMTEILQRTSAPIKVVGGPHTTTYGQIVYQQGADAVFIGDAEQTFPRWIEEGCPRGVFRGQPVNLDEIELPARDLVELDDYRIVPNDDLLFDVGSLRLPMFSSKGCPFKCTYCDVQQKTFNWKSPKKVLEEFHSLMDLGATSIHILDDCFNVKKDRVKEICEVLIEDGISIDWSARATVEVREHLIEALANAGCARLHVGIEHLDDQVLKYFKKQQRYKHVKQFCELCEKYGIHILGYFILGAPGETDAYRAKLGDMIRDLGIAIPYFNVLSPLADTAYYEELLKDGTFDHDHWAEFSRNPSRDWIMPAARSESEDEELQQIIAGYVSAFKTNAEKDIVLTDAVKQRRSRPAQADPTDETIRGEFM